MDEYLRCIKEYIEETRLGKQVHAMAEYRESSRQASDEYDLLSAGLTAEQTEILERFCAARDTMFFLEGNVLFREGVSVGTWMAVQTLSP